jgi:hypothetical protein
MRRFLVAATALVALVALAKAAPSQQGAPALPVAAHGPAATVRAIYVAEMATANALAIHARMQVDYRQPDMSGCFET